MTFLPIVSGELRVAARKRGTFWLRVAAALTALIIGSAFLTLSLLPFSGRAQLGIVLFAILTGLSLVSALASGLFFTADCVSEEKREGTLGFLFLTDLKGYDVVLGKLLATSLRGFFALLAVFPILAITFVMGGVEGGTFWKTVLALINALFFSLAGGLFVSCVSRDSQKAMGGTLLLLLFFLLGAPALDASAAWMQGAVFRPVLSYASPGYAYAMANNWEPLYWRSLLSSHFVAWIFLGLASVLISRTWQVKSGRSAVQSVGVMHRWKFGGELWRASLRQKLLNLHPIVWLMCRERWQSSLLWLLTGFFALGFVLAFISSFSLGTWFGWNYVSWAFLLLFYLGVASQAPRFFLDARRSGLIELLLAAPLTGKGIVQGQWRALRRTFGWAAGLFYSYKLRLPPALKAIPGA